MAENSKIEWTDHTFNPWIGCTKVGPGCDHCYAENMMDHRYGRVQWGAGNPRQRTSEANWRKPLAWNRDAEDAPRRPRVFCASLADVFDNEIPDEWRADLFRLIRATPNLDWLLLTKRIGNAARMIERALVDGHLLTSREPYWPWPNVWIGATVVTQAELERDGPKLHRIPARVRFYSMEPLIEDVDPSYAPPPDWIIVGGESGRNARPMAEQWALKVARYCENNGVRFFMKQGSQANWPHWKEFDRWHDELRVRQLPTGESER